MLTVPDLSREHPLHHRNWGGRWDGAQTCHARSSSPRHGAGDWDAATRGCWSSCFSILCQRHSLTVWETLHKSTSDKDALVYSQLTLCISRAAVTRQFAAARAVWQPKRGPPCSPFYPAERDVCLALTCQSQDSSSITAALSALPCHPLLPTDTVGGPNPRCGVARRTRRAQRLAGRFLCATVNLLQSQKMEISHCSKEAL